MRKSLSKRVGGAVLVALAVAGWVGCSTVSETNRKQLILISTGEEMQLGAVSFDQLKQETPVSTNAAQRAMVERVGRRIAAVAPLPDAAWEFVLFDSPEANAFCLPGGKVGIYTGILAVTQTEAGLAAVMGHEVAHAVARHGAERMSQAILFQLGGSAVDLSLKKADPEWQAAASTAYGVGTKVGLELPFSRKQESEADYMGLLYMARAGYAPAEAVKFWERFADFNRRQGGNTTPGFLRTHPLDETRIEQLKAWLPEAEQQLRPASP